jgi:hypothetical protein
MGGAGYQRLAGYVLNVKREHQPIGIDSLGTNTRAWRRLAAIRDSIERLREHPCRWAVGQHAGVRAALRGWLPGYRALYEIIPDTGRACSLWTPVRPILSCAAGSLCPEITGNAVAAPGRGDFCDGCPWIPPDWPGTIACRLGTFAMGQAKKTRASRHLSTGFLRGN